MVVPGARALFVFGVLLFGCSGAGNADLFEGASNPADTSPTEPADTSAAEPPTSPTEPTAPNDMSGVGSDTGAKDAGPGAKDAAPGTPPPPAPCTLESEPNNAIDDATTFTASFCGKIDSNNDVDFGRFVVPAGAKNLTITHAEQNGAVSYRYYLNGQVLPVQGGGIMAIPGAVYSVQIKLAANGNGNGHGNGDRPTYELKVSFD